jgi:hypothetical protein
MNMPSGRSTAPTVQAVIVNCVPIVNPQLASIIGDKLKVVMARPEDSQAASPAHSEVIASSEPRPRATCVAIVHSMFPTGHVWSAPIQILAPTTLTKVESILPEEPGAICRTMATTTKTTGPHNSPSVASVKTMVPE